MNGQGMEGTDVAIDGGEVGGAAPVEGMHPIKRLEALFKRHVNHTTELAEHVGTLFGTAAEATRLAQAAQKDAAELLEQLKAYSRTTDQRFTEIERRLSAFEQPIAAETAAAADQLSKAVDDVRAAAPGEIAYPPGEENAANS